MKPLNDISNIHSGINFGVSRGQLAQSGECPLINSAVRGSLNSKSKIKHIEVEDFCARDNK